MQTDPISVFVLLSGCLTWFIVFAAAKHAFEDVREARRLHKETKALLRKIETGQIATGVFDDGRETYQENYGRH